MGDNQMKVYSLTNLEDNYELTLIRPYTNYFLLLKDCNFKIDYVEIDTYGNLYIKDRYSWDGISFKLIETTFNLREASLVHDALYQCLREGLDFTYKQIADRIFYNLLLDAGINKFKAWVMYQAVSLFAPKSTYTPEWLL